eukprot:TRINITY_DN69303_c0_g1_i1.p1 TRINITY_DN69303_c0_g1~~TRINITY_DN69303_c0_g1_i1.p1  ORF type:complete len:344 (+),score=61.62 TRINITY_DN69303_c0_g1_i1:49-1080(+)
MLGLFLISVAPWASGQPAGVELPSLLADVTSDRDGSTGPWSRGPHAARPTASAIAQAPHAASGTDPTAARPDASILDSESDAEQEWHDPVCVDLPSKKDGTTWNDGWNGCGTYKANTEWCEKFGLKDIAGHGTAKERCCACGGGVTPPSLKDNRLHQYTATPEETFGPHHVAPTHLSQDSQEPCFDLPSAFSPSRPWNDGRHGCMEYAQNKDWCKSIGVMDHTGSGKAVDKCCACGGGRRQAAHRVPKPPPSVDAQEAHIADQADDFSSEHISDFDVSTVHDQECTDLPGLGDRPWSDGHKGCEVFAMNPMWCAKFGQKKVPGTGSAREHCCICGGGERLPFC